MLLNDIDAIIYSFCCRNQDIETTPLDLLQSLLEIGMEIELQYSNKAVTAMQYSNKAVTAMHVYHSYAMKKEFSKLVHLMK